jgi:hypothetical protein
VFIKFKFLRLPSTPCFLPRTYGKASVLIAQIIAGRGDKMRNAYTWVWGRSQPPSIVAIRAGASCTITDYPDPQIIKYKHECIKNIIFTPKILYSVITIHGAILHWKMDFRFVLRYDNGRCAMDGSPTRKLDHRYLPIPASWDRMCRRSACTWKRVSCCFFKSVETSCDW